LRACVDAQKIPPDKKKHANAPIIAFIVHRFHCGPYFLFASEQANAPRALFSTPAVLHFSGPVNLVAGVHASEHQEIERERELLLWELGSQHAHVLIHYSGAWVDSWSEEDSITWKLFCYRLGMKDRRDYFCNNNEDADEK
jgi:hypothetical protein